MAQPTPMLPGPPPSLLGQGQRQRQAQAQGQNKPPDLTESDILKRDLEFYTSLRPQFEFLANRLRCLPHIQPNSLQGRVILAASNPESMKLETEVCNAYKEVIEGLRQCRRAVEMDWVLSGMLVKAARRRGGEVVMETERERVVRSLDERDMEVDEVVWDLEQGRGRGEVVGGWWRVRAAIERLEGLRGGGEGGGEGGGLEEGVGVGIVGGEGMMGGEAIDPALGMGGGENMDGV
jgi:hypothetical protein